MTAERREDRRRRIEAAAYELLLEKGYKSTTMLAVARRASASNETMYRWYGSKPALMAALVEANAAEVRERLEAAEDPNPLETLRAAAPILLRMVTGEKAIALNRAAAADADETGALGEAIARHGREAVAPLIAAALLRARDGGGLVFDDPADAAACFIDLLIGDLQMRRAIGVLPPLDDAAAEARAAQAFDRFLRLFAAA
ncbi:MAG: TetR/AcrR family transcriptional regulator [Pseudomonadota bacterium]